MKKLFLLGLLACAFAGNPEQAEAKSKNVLNFQGTLKDAQEQVVDKNMNMTFRIFDAKTGGTEVWTENNVVAVKDGYFNVYLGTVVNLDEVNFAKELYIEITLDNGDVLPRTRLSATPFAFNAGIATAADTAEVAKSVIDGVIKWSNFDADALKAGGVLQGTFPNPTLNTKALVAEIDKYGIPGDKIAPGKYTHIEATPTGRAYGDVEGSTFPHIYIADNKIDTKHIKPLAVTNDKIGPKAITDDKIADGAIKPPQIDDDAVLSRHIKNGEVKTDDIDGKAVTNEKIDDNAVTSDKIFNGTIKSEDIGAKEVKTANIDDEAVTNDQIANATIEVGKFAKLAPGKVNENKVLTIDDQGVPGYRHFANGLNNAPAPKANAIGQMYYWNGAEWKLSNEEPMKDGQVLKAKKTGAEWDLLWSDDAEISFPLVRDGAATTPKIIKFDKEEYNGVVGATDLRKTDAVKLVKVNTSDYTGAVMNLQLEDAQGGEAVKIGSTGALAHENGALSVAAEAKGDIMGVSKGLAVKHHIVKHSTHENMAADFVNIVKQGHDGIASKGINVNATNESEIGIVTGADVKANGGETAIGVSAFATGAKTNNVSVFATDDATLKADKTAVVLAKGAGKDVLIVEGAGEANKNYVATVKSGEGNRSVLIEGGDWNTPELLEDPTDLDNAALVVRATPKGAIPATLAAKIAVGSADALEGAKGKTAIKTYGDVFTNSAVSASSIIGRDRITIGTVAKRITKLTPPTVDDGPADFSTDIRMPGLIAKNYALIGESKPTDHLTVKALAKFRGDIEVGPDDATKNVTIENATGNTMTKGNLTVEGEEITHHNVKAIFTQKDDKAKSVIAIARDAKKSGYINLFNEDAGTMLEADATGAKATNAGMVAGYGLMKDGALAGYSVSGTGNVAATDGVTLAFKDATNADEERILVNRGGNTAFKVDADGEVLTTGATITQKNDAAVLSVQKADGTKMVNAQVATYGAVKNGYVELNDDQAANNKQAAMDTRGVRFGAKDSETAKMSFVGTNPNAYGTAYVASVGEVKAGNKYGAALTYDTDNTVDETRIMVANGDAAAPVFKVDREGDLTANSIKVERENAVDTDNDGNGDKKATALHDATTFEIASEVSAGKTDKVGLILDKALAGGPHDRIFVEKENVRTFAVTDEGSITAIGSDSQLGDSYEHDEIAIMATVTDKIISKSNIMMVDVTEDKTKYGAPTKAYTYADNKTFKGIDPANVKAKFEMKTDATDASLTLETMQGAAFDEPEKVILSTEGNNDENRITVQARIGAADKEMFTVNRKGDVTAGGSYTLYNGDQKVVEMTNTAGEGGDIGLYTEIPGKDNEVAFNIYTLDRGIIGKSTGFNNDATKKKVGMAIVDTYEKTTLEVGDVDAEDVEAPAIAGDKAGFMFENNNAPDRDDTRIFVYDGPANENVFTVDRTGDVKASSYKVEKDDVVDTDGDAAADEKATSLQDANRIEISSQVNAGPDKFDRVGLVLDKSKSANDFSRIYVTNADDVVFKVTNDGSLVANGSQSTLGDDVADKLDIRSEITVGLAADEQGGKLTVADVTDAAGGTVFGSTTINSRAINLGDETTDKLNIMAETKIGTDQPNESGKFTVDAEDGQGETNINSKTINLGDAADDELSVKATLVADLRTKNAIKLFDNAEPDIDADPLTKKNASISNQQVRMVRPKDLGAAINEASITMQLKDNDEATFVLSNDYVNGQAGKVTLTSKTENGDRISVENHDGVKFLVRGDGELTAVGNVLLGKTDKITTVFGALAQPKLVAYMAQPAVQAANWEATAGTGKIGEIKVFKVDNGQNIEGVVFTNGGYITIINLNGANDWEIIATHAKP